MDAGLENFSVVVFLCKQGLQGEYWAFSLLSMVPISNFSFFTFDIRSGHALCAQS